MPTVRIDEVSSRRIVLRVEESCVLSVNRCLVQQSIHVRDHRRDGLIRDKRLPADGGLQARHQQSGWYALSRNVPD